MAFVIPEFTQGAHKELSVRPRFKGGSPLLIGLEGYWPGVEGGGQFSDDISSRQCYGIGNGLLARSVTPRFSQAFNLNSLNTSILAIRRSQITQHCTNANAMSFSIWMMTSYTTLTTDPLYMSIINFGTAQKLKQAMWVINTGCNGQMELRVTFDGSNILNDLVIGNATVADGYWHNYTCVFDSIADPTSIYVYIDGLLAFTGETSFAVNNGEDTTLGFANASYVCNLWGFGVWSRLLTAAEAYTIWQEPYLMLAQPPVLRYNQLGGAARIFDLMPFLPM